MTETHRWLEEEHHFFELVLGTMEKAANDVFELVQKRGGLSEDLAYANYYKSRLNWSTWIQYFIEFVVTYHVSSRSFLTYERANRIWQSFVSKAASVSVRDFVIRFFETNFFYDENPKNVLSPLF